MNPKKFAVLIPVYNEEIVIGGTIDALVAAGMAISDIYVVNDKSTDNTAAVAASYGVSVYTVPVNGGKARAQTAALQYFMLCDRYDWIIFLDGDSKVGKNFGNSLKSAAYNDPAVALFVGQVKSVKNDHVFSAYRSFEYTLSHDLAKKAQDNFNVVYVSPGCASMYRADVLSKLEIDSATLAEDMDLTIQVHRLGMKVSYIEGAEVYTQDPNNMKDYHKQILRWYRGFWQVVKKHNVLWWGPKRPVDLYMWMIIADAIFLNRFVYLAAVIMAFPGVSLIAILVDIGFAFAIACYSAWKTKRVDVITKFPIYYWLGYLNFYALSRAFIETMVMRKNLLTWNKVKRYEYNNNTTT
jgi:cellulose synthase/poly-beta-1,6-N-acetylglucosamine synthase-like glycosyltransferase